MGTNYYAKTNPCAACGESKTRLHLGKSSAGWKFLLQANGFDGYKTWSEMKEWLEDKIIEDEYGEVVSIGEFIELVERKQSNPELWNHGANSSQNIPVGFAMRDCEGYEFHNGDFS